MRVHNHPCRQSVARQCDLFPLPPKLQSGIDNTIARARSNGKRSYHRSMIGRPWAAANLCTAHIVTHKHTGLEGNVAARITRCWWRSQINVVDTIVDFAVALNKFAPDGDVCGSTDSSSRSMNLAVCHLCVCSTPNSNRPDPPALLLWSMANQSSDRCSSDDWAR